ncbi:MAG: Rrf2 family transcriptional regulator [Pirellulales bacterium]|nr:Rrf2 family transcriptional regulator [Pirellulales bacterium]
MRLALQTDYALRTLIYLAGKPGRAHVADVAQFFQISAHHVGKVVHQLGRLGFVRSIRGVGGGIELARAPEAIRVGEVVLAFEGNLHLLDCVGVDAVCVIQPNCRLRSVLAEAERIQLEYLNGVYLSDVVRPGKQLVELRPVPPKGKSRPRRAGR